MADLSPTVEDAKWLREYIEGLSAAVVGEFCCSDAERAESEAELSRALAIIDKFHLRRAP